MAATTRAEQGWSQEPRSLAKLPCEPRKWLAGSWIWSGVTETLNKLDQTSCFNPSGMGCGRPKWQLELKVSSNFWHFHIQSHGCGSQSISISSVLPQIFLPVAWRCDSPSHPSPGSRSSTQQTVLCPSGLILSQVVTWTASFTYKVYLSILHIMWYIQAWLIF